MKFTFVVLSLGAARADDENGYVGPGEWVLLKCFGPEGREFGEFYLNLNVNTKEGEIVAKEETDSSWFETAFQRMLTAELEMPAA